MRTFTPPGPLRLPVLLTAFKRYEETRMAMNAIREARPPRLYFACDGPRNEAERVRTDKVRTLVELVDWPCELRTFFHGTNQGVKAAMVANLEWFFEHEPEGIVLEDDIVAAKSFFWFAQDLLEKYRDDHRIWAIVGNNLATGGATLDPQGYWFLAHGYGAYWGWAGWRRTWKQFDITMKDWPEIRDNGWFNDHFLSRGEREQVTQMFEDTWNGTLPGAWDYQLDHARLKAGAINIIPNVNLCRNVGFGDDATHSVKVRDPRNQEHLHEAAWPLVHPGSVIVDAERNLKYFNAYVRAPVYDRFKAMIKNMLPAPLDQAVTPFFSRLQKQLGLR